MLPPFRLLRTGPRRGCAKDASEDGGTNTCCGCACTGCLVFLAIPIVAAMVQAAESVDWISVGLWALAIAAVGAVIAVLVWHIRQKQRRANRPERLRRLIRRAKQRRSEGNLVGGGDDSEQRDRAGDAQSVDADEPPAPPRLTANIPRPVGSDTHVGGVRATRSDSEMGTCPVCQSAIRANEMIVICPECETAHHAGCWDYNGGCAVYGCSMEPSG